MQPNPNRKALMCGVIVVSFAFANAAVADENGAMTYQEYKCANSAMSSIVTVCEKVKNVFPGVECPKTERQCVTAQQEIFTGVTGEGATPQNVKAWNGQGGGGELYQTVGLCLMRDLATTPMRSKATASLPIGNISAKGLVDYRAFNKEQRTFNGYHRLTAKAPVIGEVDIVTQPFSMRAVSSDVRNRNAKVGEYGVYAAHALAFEADGGAEDFSFEIDSIRVHTPYGTVTPKPRLKLARASGWSLSPYGGSFTALLNPGALQMTDVYGRLAGQTLASSLTITEIKPEKFVIDTFCQDFAASPMCQWPKPTGWASQLMLGSRNVDPNAAAWTAPNGVAFPARPDADTAAARGEIEKTPGGHAEAGVKVEYSPVELIPAAIRNNGFTSIDLVIWADPNISVDFASQFNFWNGQGAAWNPALTPPQQFPAPVTPTPVDVESLQTIGVYSGTSVAGRFAVDAGVDLTIRFRIPLPRPLKDIKFTIIDIHPRTAFLETEDAGVHRSEQQALVMSDWQHFLRTADLYKVFTPLAGGAVNGAAYIQKCLADPPPDPKEPEDPSYTPGDPEDLIEFLDMPCNICMGHAEFQYLDVKTQTPLTFEVKTIPGVARKEPPVDDSAFAPSDRWVCGGPLPRPIQSVALPKIDPADITTAEAARAFNDAAAASAVNSIKNLGCYDQCRVNQETGAFELIASAKQLFAQGVITDTPNGCH